MADEVEHVEAEVKNVAGKAKNVLLRKVGPAPLGVWIIAGVVMGYFALKAKKHGKFGAMSPHPAHGVHGGGSGRGFGSGQSPVSPVSAVSGGVAGNPVPGGTPARFTSPSPGYAGTAVYGGSRTAPMAFMSNVQTGGIQSPASPFSSHLYTADNGQARADFHSGERVGYLDSPANPIPARSGADMTAFHVGEKLDTGVGIPATPTSTFVPSSGAEMSAHAATERSGYLDPTPAPIPAPAPVAAPAYSPPPTYDEMNPAPAGAATAATTDSSTDPNSTRFL